MQNEILKAAQETASYINKLESDLEHYRAHCEYLQGQIDHYVYHFGTFEDVQAQAVAPSEDLFNFTPEDVAELNEQDAKLTENQMQAYYNAETHAAYHQNNRNA